MTKPSYKATYRTRTYGGNTTRKRHTPRVPGVRIENELRDGGALVVAGVDEVGVGAWAGPVAVGAVVLDPTKRIYKVRDSKLVDPARREWLSERVRERALSWSVGFAWPEEIDSWGLSEAIRTAGRRCVEGLSMTPDAFLLDGKWNFLGDGTRMVVRGDAESVSIAAASLVAKVERDRLMQKLDGIYPAYEFWSNKGYPSPRHKWALLAMGPTPIHRRLFAPVRKFFDEGVPGRLLPG